MRSTSSRSWVTAVSLASVFLFGMAAGHLTQREAHAQSLSTSTIYVPPGGLVFRAPDGAPLARLSRDAHGGTFELFDDRQEVSVRAPRVTPVWPTQPPATRDDPGY